MALTLSSGRSYDRAAMLAQAANNHGEEMHVTWADETVRRLGSDAMLVSSRVTDEVGPLLQTYRYATVLQRDGTGWRVAFAQSTREAAFTRRVSTAISGPLGDYAGSYRTPRGLALRVSVTDSALTLFEPSGKAVPMDPIGPGLFEFRVLSPENGVVRLLFSRDATGRVTTFTQLAPGVVNSFPRME
jgi:hypothetical protein